MLISIAMYPEICSYDEQGFDRKWKKKKNMTVKKSLWPVPRQGMVEQAKTHGGFRSQQGYRGNACAQTQRHSGFSIFHRNLTAGSIVGNYIKKKNIKKQSMVGFST